MHFKKFIAPSLIIALLLILYIPVFRWLISSWLNNPYYNHGFLIPLVSGFFIWRNWDSMKPVKPSNSGMVVLALGAFAYIIGFLWLIRFASALSLIIILSGLVIYFYGTRAIRLMAFPLGFLVFMIPPPFQADLLYWLQRISINYSASLLELTGFTITTSGSEITLRDNTFTIGLPCSGMSSVVALLALAAVFTYLLTGSFYKRAALFIAAFPIAIISNILRITSIILMADYHNVDFATGFYHDISSLIFFFMAFLFLVLCSRIMRCRLIVSSQKE